MSKRLVELQNELYEFLIDQIEKEGVFKSVESYVNFVLKELFLHEEKTSIEDEETRLIEQRLRDIGQI